MLYMKKRFLYILFSLLTIVAYGKETGKVDSLQQQLTKARGKSRVNTLNSLAWELRRKTVSIAKEYSLEALQLSKRIGFKKGEAKALFHFGVVYAIHNKYDSSKFYFKKAAYLYNYLNNNKELSRVYNGLALTSTDKGEHDSAAYYYKVAIKVLGGDSTGDAAGLIYGNLSNLYIFQGKYEEALYNTKKALDITFVKNKKRVGSYYISLGIIYRNLHRYKEAMEAYFNGLKIAKEINEYILEAKIYSNLGNLYKALGQYEKALESFEKGLNYHKKIGDRISVAMDYTNIGNVYRKKRELEKALEYYSKSLAIKKKLKSTNQIWTAYINIGGTLLDSGLYHRADSFINIGLKYSDSASSLHGKALGYSKLTYSAYKKKDFEQSIAYARQGLAISEGIGALKNSQDMYGVLILTYEELNKTDSALEYLKKYQLINDSIINNSSPFELADLLSKEEIEKKEAELIFKRSEIQLLKEKEQNNRLKKILLIVSIMALAIAIILIYVIQKRRIKENKKQFDKKERVLVEKKETAEAELEKKKREVTSLALNISRQSSLLNNVRETLETSKSLNTLQNSVKQILSQDSFAEKEWEHFNSRFTSLHPKFIENLRKGYPELTTNDIRLCMLIKTELDTNEIASTLNITIPSVNSARYRIRKKLSIPKEITLENFIYRL